MRPLASLPFQAVQDLNVPMLVGAEAAWGAAAGLLAAATAGPAMPLASRAAEAATLSNQRDKFLAAQRAWEALAAGTEMTARAWLAEVTARPQREPGTKALKRNCNARITGV